MNLRRLALLVVTVIAPACDPDPNQPRGESDSYSVAEDGAFSIVAPGVLVNDVDPNGDPLRALLIAAPANGTLVLNPDGGFSYTPVADFNGTDVFVYRAADAELESTDVRVTVAVEPTNDLPIARAGADRIAVVGERVVVSGASSSDLEGASLTYIWSLRSAPQGSRATLSDTTAVSPAFTVDVIGRYEVELKVSDGELTSFAETLVVTVSPAVDWMSSVLLSVVPQGAEIFERVSFIARTDLTDVVVGVSADLSTSVSASPSLFVSIRKGESREVTLRLSSAIDAPEQVLSGAVNLRLASDNAMLTESLFVALTVEKWERIVVPEAGISVALPRRLLRDAAASVDTKSKETGEILIDILASKPNSPPNSAVGLFVSANRERRSIEDWFGLNVDQGDLLLRDAIYRRMAFSDGRTLLEFSRPPPEGYEGDLAQFYVTNRLGDRVLAVDFSHDHDIEQLGYMDIESQTGLLKGIIGALRE